MGRHYTVKEKTCLKCKVTLPRRYFDVRDNGALDTFCRECRAKHGYTPYKPRAKKDECRISDRNLSGHEALAGAIIKLAIKDYNYLKRKGKQHAVISGRNVSISELDKFFESEIMWYTTADLSRYLGKAE